VTAPTLAEIQAWPATVSLADACAALGFSRSWGYELVARGEFPCRVLTVGSRRHRVITAGLLHLLSEWETPGPEPPGPGAAAAMTATPLPKDIARDHRNASRRRSA
jgi:hypothetical protein